MANQDTNAEADRFEVRATADTHFGWLCTRLSVERTMMSWVRTAVSLIGFGFAIVQFFERLQQMPGTQAALIPAAPKYPGSCFDFLWNRSAHYFYLAVQLDRTLPTKRIIR